MTGNYGPAAAAAAAAAAGNTTGRTVYVGNLPSSECSFHLIDRSSSDAFCSCVLSPDANVDELMNLVRFGPVESVRLLPEKSCVFISFLDGATAAAFHADATVKKLTLHGQELKIGWGKPSTVPNTVVHAIATSKATRNVYLGGLDEKLSESELRDDLSRFGPIDQVKIVRDKSIGFVHFLSISAAMKVSCGRRRIYADDQLADSRSLPLAGRQYPCNGTCLGRQEDRIRQGELTCIAPSRNSLLTLLITSPGPLRVRATSTTSSRTGCSAASSGGTRSHSRDARCPLPSFQSAITCCSLQPVVHPVVRPERLPGIWHDFSRYGWSSHQWR